MNRLLSSWMYGLLLGAALGGSAAALAQEAAPAEVTVARVAGESITRTDLVRQLLTYFGRPGLEMLTDRSVLDQEAALRKLVVTDADVDARVAEAKKAGGADLQKALQQGGITEQNLQGQARYSLLMEKLLDSKWPVTNDDLVRLSVRFARTLSQQQAREIINEAKRGVSFELLSIREPALDGGEFRGLAQPDPFLRVENPPMFRLAQSANLRVGQFTPQPIQSGKYWMVLKLEKRLGAETLTGKLREQAIAKVRASRAGGLMPASRKRYRITSVTPVAKLIEDLKLPGDTVVSKIGDAPITRKELLAYLFDAFGKTALDQLIERRIVSQQAARFKVSLSDAEVKARVDAVKKQTGEATFQNALGAEGITEDAWQERVRYTYLAEKLVNARAPVRPEELERLTVRYVRVAGKPDAEEVIRLAQSGAKFEQIVTQKSLDRTGDGFLKPKLFMRSENPEAFTAIDKAKLQTGQVLAQPLEVAGSFFVLKLEGRFGPELMSAKEKEDAIRRINAYRMSQLLDTWRSEVKVEYPTPLKTLIAEARR
jgi:foldase protein PrsA